jgi:arylsulfatase
VGRILRALDALGLAEDTLVVFSTDHGEMMGDHGLFQKSKPYEASARIPFLVRFPGRVAAGQRATERVSLTDLMPTFLAAAGVDYPRHPGLLPLPGASLLGRPGGGLATPRETFVIAEGIAPARWWSVVQGPWKYNYDMRGAWEELFNLEDDPQERRSLLPGSPGDGPRRVASELRQLLLAWERDHGFASSFDAAGDLRRSPIPDRTGPVVTNGQFPTWVENLPPEELALMESPGESVLNAMRHEMTYRLTDLNLAAFKRAGGSLAGTPYQRLLDDL